jgi:hypothetical protein
LEEEALDRTFWRTRFGREYGPVVDITFFEIHFEFRLFISRPKELGEERQIRVKLQQTIGFSRSGLHYTVALPL